MEYSSTLLNDNVDTLRSENEMMVFKNVFNDWYARDCSKKIKAVFKAKGQSGKPLTTIPPYGYKNLKQTRMYGRLTRKPQRLSAEFFSFALTDMVRRRLREYSLRKKFLRLLLTQNSKNRETLLVPNLIAGHRGR